MLNKVKIIAGQWRGRHIEFPETPGLRPTPNRIRETLFNWLAPSIHNAFFLDAFGGSGALSFEALSRGASRGVYIDNQQNVRQYCRHNTDRLKTEDLMIISGQAPACFASLKIKQPFDIVFLDPPFQQNLLMPSLKTLTELDLIGPNSLVYFEVEKELNLENLLADRFTLIKNQQAGQVHYGLMKRC